MNVNFTKSREEFLWKFAKSTLFLFVILLLFSQNLMAQNITVSGTVSDGSTTETIPGASVSIKGKRTAVMTNDQGKFSISASGNDILVITYLGYLRQEVPIQNRTQITISLKSSASDLDEVVVMGYGTVAKSDVTGSISSVKLKDVNETKAISVTEALQGKVSGVNIVTNTGEPGGAITFNIRGMTSITGSNQPLIVIDGQPIESSFGATYAGSNLDGGADIPPADPLAALNTNDIASIEILKDASSTAIYGSRGANGVVLITTKSGAEGKDRVSYSTRWDVSQLPKQLEMLSSYEYMQYRNEAAVNSGATPVYNEAQLDSISRKSNTNWQDHVYRDAISQDHQITFSGRDKKYNYLLTANYSEQASIIKKAGFTKGGVRLNFEKEITPKLRVGLRTYLSKADRKFGLQSNWTGILGSTVVMGALTFNPLQNAVDPVTGLDNEDLTNGPMLLINKVIDRTGINTIISNFNADYTISKNLTFTVKGGVNEIYSLRNIWYPTGTFIGDSAPGGSATRADNSNSNYLVESLLSYKKVFQKKHSVNAVLGYSYQKWFNKATSYTALGFPSNTLSYYNIEGATFPGRLYSSDRNRALESLIGRVNYSYDRKYLLTLTSRYDGSTRLSPGNKWSLYPSVGLGWNVSNEGFIKDNLEFLSLFKLRTSIGVAGNDNIGIGGAQSAYGLNHYPVGDNIVPGFVLSRMENPYLKWERTTKYNAGVDFGFMKDKLTVSVDVYKHVTTDLLIGLALPASSGFGSYNTNVGKILNQGLDIEALYKISSKNFSLDLGANFSTFSNKVDNLGKGSVLYGGSFFAGGQFLLSQPVTAAFVGQPISNFLGYKTNGIYQNQAEIDNDPALANDAAKATISPGMIKYVDIDGDGQISGADRTTIGNATPDFNFGFNPSLSYKKLSVSMTIFGSYGGELINLNRWMVGSNHANTAFNSLKDAYLGRWNGEGTSNLYPKLTTNAVRLQQRVPDWMVEDASFVRLQNINIGYTFALPKRFKLGGLRVFVTGTNLLTITNYTGYDPNVNSFGQTALNYGVDLGTLPQARTFSAGATLSL
jgi:TonB-linked SusC/RagA family outer membrane protein